MTRCVRRGVALVRLRQRPICSSAAGRRSGGAARLSPARCCLSVGVLSRARMQPPCELYAAPGCRCARGAWARSREIGRKHCRASRHRPAAQRMALVAPCRGSRGQPAAAPQFGCHRRPPPLHSRVHALQARLLHGGPAMARAAPARRALRPNQTPSIKTACSALLLPSSAPRLAYKCACTGAGARYARARRLVRACARFVPPHVCVSWCLRARATARGVLERKHHARGARAPGWCRLVLGARAAPPALSSPSPFHCCLLLCCLGCSPGPRAGASLVVDARTAASTQCPSLVRQGFHRAPTFSHRCGSCGCVVCVTVRPL